MIGISSDSCSLGALRFAVPEIGAKSPATAKAPCLPPSGTICPVSPSLHSRHKFVEAGLDPSSIYLGLEFKERLAVKQLSFLFIVSAAVGLAACGNYSSSMSGASNQTPVVTGNWNVVFAPAAPSTSTSLTVTFTQNGNALAGTVTAVNNSASSCFPTIMATGTTFNVTGQVSAAQSGSNLNVSVAFTSGSSSGTVTGAGSLAYLGTMANGTFSFPTGASGCTSGTFTMTKM